jgi:hypothetical protein
MPNEAKELQVNMNNFSSLPSNLKLWKENTIHCQIRGEIERGSNTRILYFHLRFQWHQSTYTHLGIDIQHTIPHGKHFFK